MGDFAFLFYVPNVIDYARILLIVYGVYVLRAAGDRDMFAICYVLSYGLDLIDGPIARMLNQTSKLGIYLDMICDRISSCLLLYLAASAIIENHSLDEHFEEAKQDGVEGFLHMMEKLSVIDYFYVFFIFMLWFCLMFVEILSHGVVMIQSEVYGVHQKEMRANSWLVRTYLGNKAVLGWSCISFELTGLMLFLDYPFPLVLLALPGFIFRALANLRRLLDATVLRYDFKKDNKDL